MNAFLTYREVAQEVRQFIKNDTNDIDVKMLFVAMPVELKRFKTPAHYLQDECNIYHFSRFLFKFPTTFYKEFILSYIYYFSVYDYYSTKDYHQKCKMQDRPVKWCVVTKLETEKCMWLSFSARAYGVEPLIECVQEISQEKCLKTVNNGWTDIFSIKPNLLSEAKK